jgi:hypothetical protein
VRPPRLRFTVRLAMVVVALAALLSGAEVARRRWVYCQRKAAPHQELHDQYAMSADARENSVRAARAKGEGGKTLPRFWAMLAADDRLRAAHHAAIAGMYRAAATRPWLAISPEPAEPPSLDTGRAMEQILQEGAP